MKRKVISLLATATVLALVLTSLATAAPTGVGTPKIRMRATANPNVSEIYADGLAEDGAVAFDIYLNFDHSNGVSIASVEVGADMAAVPNCGTFVTSRADPYAPNPGDDPNGALIGGYCTGNANPGLLGSNKLIMKVNWNCGTSGGFLVNVDDGVPFLTAGAVTAFAYPPFSDSYYVPDNDLIDGGACGNPTAVTLGNVSAGPVAPMSNALYLAAAGGLALLAAAGLALRGIRKH